MATIEQALESNFVKWCKEKEIVAIKGPSATAKGFPDRFLQLPNFGGTIYVEFKGTSYYDLTPIQVWWKNYLKASDPLRYFVIDTKEDLENLKLRCEQFMQIGAQIVEYENKLLSELDNKIEFLRKD